MFFAFFEILVRWGGSDPSVLQRERTRMTALTDLLHRSQYPSITWDEWVDATMELFDSTIKALPDGDGVQNVEKGFNDEANGLAPALVQHLRVRRSL